MQNGKGGWTVSACWSPRRVSDFLIVHVHVQRIYSAHGHVIQEKVESELQVEPPPHMLQLQQHSKVLHKMDSSPGFNFAAPLQFQFGDD